MDLEQIKILLERYNQGICTPEEAEMVEQWFDRINQHQSTITNDRELNLQLSDIKSRIDEQIAPRTPVRYLRRWYAAAAVAAVLLVAAGIIWLQQHTPTNEATGNTQLAAASTTTTRIIKDGFVEITTPRTVKDTIHLQDGSSIVLNSGSKLRYPEHFSNTERSIYLEEGEAFFDAAPDPGRSFVVRTTDLATTALGTTFNIRAYTTENKVTVALLTGKVKVDQLNAANSKASSLVLLPSEQISFDRQQLSLIKTSFAKPEDVSGWKQGYLVFKDASYNEIVNGIENRFGVTVINQSNKTEWNYTGFFRNESLKDVMDIICIATSLSYTIKKDTVYLVNKN
ncbi:MAG TPA: FecR domain-containing protein [Chitinophaga sp.]|uniref:FecR family protein n=1 Tax=Chitinophaga sp. TaxID=1869181 RepID=UPI002CB7755A|nr:FecR domain-containing protein [Chitinophaga sp.]HVI47624.1 FecR domain-containing protein [Chitinophaga sp.]